MDLLSSYIPKFEELTPAQLQSARLRVVELLQAARPGVDFGTDTVAGDHLATPAAVMLAGIEVAAERLCSDFNLANVAQGIVFNCDVVNMLLTSLGAYELAAQPARGTVRLVFADDTQRTIDRSIQFSFGDSRLFSPIAPGNEIVLKTAPSAVNDYAYSTAAEGGYQVLIPVEGTADTAVAAGTPGLINLPISGLISISAFDTVTSGSREETVAQMAERVRTTFSLAGYGTPTGVEALVLKRFQDIVAAGTLTSNDNRLTRAALVAGGVADLHVRAKTPYIEVTERVKIPYFHAAENFVGVWIPSRTPVLIRSVKHISSTVELIEETSLFAKSTAPERAPLYSAGFSGLEAFQWQLPMQFDDDDQPELPLVTDPDNGDQWAVFEVVYWADPTSDTVRRYTAHPATAPAGIDLLVKPMIPLVIEKFEVTYARVPGVDMALQTAQAEIEAYLNSRGGDYRWSVGAIYDIMRYAGARDVRGISATGKVVFSAADGHVPEGVDWNDAAEVQAEAVAPPVLGVTDSSNLALTLSDAAKHAVVTELSLGYLLLPGAVRFKEVRA